MWVRRDIIALQRIAKPQIAIVDNLERQDRPFYSFIVIMLLMVLMAGGMILYFKRRK
jgi:hypothetical protein